MKLVEMRALDLCNQRGRRYITIYETLEKLANSSVNAMPVTSVQV